MQESCLGFSNLQRKWINVGLNKEIDVAPWDPSNDGPMVYLSSIEIEVSLFVKNNEIRAEFDAKEMARHFATVSNNQVLVVDQAVVLDFQDTRLILVPKLVQLVSSETLMNSTRGPDGEVLRTLQGTGTVFLSGMAFCGHMDTDAYTSHMLTSIRDNESR